MCAALWLLALCATGAFDTFCNEARSLQRTTTFRRPIGGGSDDAGCSVCCSIGGGSAHNPINTVRPTMQVAAATDATPDGDQYLYTVGGRICQS